MSTSATDSNPASPPAASDFAGSRWRFVEINGNAVPAGVNATLAFGTDGHASGHAGCNSYGGPYQADADGTMHFGGMISTKMACLQPTGAMEAEHGVFHALRLTARVRVEQTRMMLLDASGAGLAVLSKQSVP